ncbi:MAG: hypothetical protein ABIO24_10205 [Saprospiraceae bacterium]
MPGVPQNILRITVSAACCGLTVFLGYYVQRSEFGWLLAAYGLFFGLYLAIAFGEKELSASWQKGYLGLGIALRVLLLFSLPNLSDDFYRFVWDGHLTVACIHPFAQLPVYFVTVNRTVPGLSPELFAQLNSPTYFTVYPPLCQAIFALAVWVSPHSLWGEVVVMKLFLLAGELGTLRLVSRLGSKQKVLLYALNPLLILEIVGNCHFEGLMIFFLLAGWYVLQRQRLAAAAGFWGMATAIKLLPPLFLPLVWRWLGGRRGWRFQLFFAGACGLLFLPLLDQQVLMNMSQSLELYFQRFEFNASWYYLVRQLGQWWTGYYYVKIIGPVLGLVTLLGTLWLTGRTQTAGRAEPRRWPLPETMLWAVFLYLSCATTVHPWYATVPLALSLLTSWRFPLLWSGLIVLSYSHYARGGSAENFWLIGLEYGILWAFIGWEVSTRRRNGV